MMKNFENGKLRIVLQEFGDHTELSWLGESNDRNPGLLLNPYLTAVAGNLDSQRATLSFENLEYMNSSTVPPIILLMKMLEEKGVKTEITYSTRVRWQGATFKALETLCLMMNHVTVKGI